MATTARTEHEKIHHRYVDEIFNGREYDVYDELTTDEYVQHMGEVSRDVAEVKGFLGAIHEAFPDVEATVEHLINDGDFVCSLHRYRGTHEGAFMGIEPTGTEVAIRSLSLSRFENGKLAETWVIPDLFGLMQQVGAIPDAE